MAGDKKVLSKSGQEEVAGGNRQLRLPRHRASTKPSSPEPSGLELPGSQNRSQIGQRVPSLPSFIRYPGSPQTRPNQRPKTLSLFGLPHRQMSTNTTSSPTVTPDAPYASLPRHTRATHILSNGLPIPMAGAPLPHPATSPVTYLLNQPLSRKQLTLSLTLTAPPSCTRARQRFSLAPAPLPSPDPPSPPSPISLSSAARHIPPPLICSCMP